MGNLRGRQHGTSDPGMINAGGVRGVVSIAGRIIVCGCLCCGCYCDRPAGGERTEFPREATEGTAVASPRGVVTIGILLLVVRFRSLPPSSSSLRSRSPLPVHHVLSTYRRPTPSLRITSRRFLIESLSVADDCPPRGQEPFASSYLYLERERVYKPFQTTVSCILFSRL